MNTSHIMTTPVITVGPETPVREIATLLLENRISGVPVLENGRLIGLVSEADLLHRHEIGTDCAAPAGSWWLRLFSADRSPSDYIRSHARQARDVMAREIVSVTEDTPVADIANLLEARRIKRVPVMNGEKLVGIVSRANLVQALAATRRLRTTANPDSDSATRGRLLAELERQPWWRTASSSVIVADGVVHYWGLLYSDDEREAARVAAENVPGVSRIEDHRHKIEDLPSMV